MPDIRKEIETTYAPSTDITFIMEATYKNDNLIKYEVVSWYSGEPNDSDTDYFNNNRRPAAVYE